MSKIIILSGISGSGKNTYIKQNFSEAIVCSADDYFEQDGVYKFDANWLGDAHASCMRKFIKNILSVESDPTYEIVVNNTNTTVLEIAPYYAVASAYQFSIELHTLIADPIIAAKRNVHNVDQKTCEAMAQRLTGRILPFYWKFSKNIRLVSVDNKFIQQ